MQLSPSRFCSSMRRFHPSTPLLANGRAVVCLCFVALLLVEGSRGQQLPPQKLDLKTLSSEGRMHPAPVSHLYMNFLLHQNHLDRLATARDTAGKNGNQWRSYFQAKLGFDEGQMGAIRSAGLRLESELRDIGTKAVAIAKANRAARAAANIDGPITP